MKKLFITILCLVFLSSIVSAQPPFQQTISETGIQIESPVIEYHKLEKNFCFAIHIHNATNGLILKNDTTNCIIHIYRPSDGEHVFIGNMSFSNNIDFETNITSGNFTEVGQYAVLFYCEVPGQIGGFFEYGFEVNVEGMEMSLQDSIVRIFLLLFFVGVSLGLYLVRKNIDFKKWNDNTIEKYKNKNLVKMVLSAILYNIMKNFYIIYYLIGLPIILIATNLAYVYNITSIIALMNAVLLVYIIGIIIVGIVFLSYAQEWVMETLELVEDMDWGIEK